MNNSEVSIYAYTRMGDIATLVKRPVVIPEDASVRSLGVKWYGKGAYIAEEKPGYDLRAERFEVHENDLIYNDMWARHGSVAIVPAHLDRMVASAHFPTWELDLDRVYPPFLSWYFQTPTFWSDCEEKSQGSTGRNAITKALFRELLIPLPSLDEQRRIVAHIDTIAEQIAAARGLRQSAVEETEAFLISSVNDIFSKSTWESQTLKNLLAEDSLNGLGSRPSDEPRGVPILRISAGTSRPNGLVDEHDYKYLEVAETILAKYQLRQGDLLACRFNGNLHYVGRFSLYTANSGQFHIYPDKLMRFRVDTRVVLPAFVKEAMNSPYGRIQIEAHCATTAGNIGISAGKLKTVRIPLPSIDEQRNIVAYLDSLQAEVERLKHLQAETVSEIDALLPSLLDRAFKGEL